MSRRRHRVLLALAVTTLTVLAGPALRADAHAELVSSTPADGSVVPTAPRSVTLDFSEGITVNSGGIRVLDGNGARVDRGNARVVAGDRATVGLRSGLRRGTYVVAWRAVSADSHPIHGGFTFSIGAPGNVGAGVVSSALDQQGNRLTESLAAALRGFAYAGAMLAAGGALFLLVAGDNADRRLVAPLLTAGAGTAMVAVLASVPIQASLATGLGLGAMTEPGVARQVLGEGLGLSVLGVVLGQALLILAVHRPRDRATGTLTATGFILGAGSFALAGHTRVSEPALVSNLADLVHVLAGAAWFGGLVVLLIALRRRFGDDDPGGAAALVARFSTLVVWPLVAVTVAGLILAWSEVRVADALTSTTYGHLLLVKVALVGVVIAAGAYNRYRLVPVVAGSTDLAEVGDHATQAEQAGAGSAEPAVPHARQWAVLGRTLKIEILGLLAAIAVTGVLVNVTPARTVAGVGTVASATVPLGSGTVNLTVDPARAGTNTIHLYFLDRTGRPVDTAQQVALQFRLPAADLGPIDALAVKAAPGHWQYDGDDMTIAGQWQVTVVATTSRFDEARATAQVRIRP